MSNRIAILPDRVANQIAAGEVVERPVAVVKELVENSLDAGATRVEVEFRNGGKSLIRVDDNGHGMSRDDALLALERHATSKIREAADLDSVGTFGFRGEALPSIASVSRFTLRTRRQEDPHGTEVLVNGGKLLHVRETGMPVGTSVEVAHLFNSVPARRKFLKTDKTEAAHIVQLCRLLATAHPAVAFSLLEDGREVFRSPQCPSLSERVAEIFGGSVVGDLIPLAAENGPLRLHGLIGKPGIGRATRQDMHTYVNLRPVESRTLTYALIESYHTHLPKGRYPVAFLFLTIDPASVDVNVHPAKREVRFRDEAGVRQFVMRNLIARLNGGGEAEGGGNAQCTMHNAQIEAENAKFKIINYKGETGAGNEEGGSKKEEGGEGNAQCTMHNAQRNEEGSIEPVGRQSGMRNEECKMKNEEVGAGNSKLEIINSKGEEKAEDRQPRRVAQSLGRGLANVNWQFLSYLHESFVLFETRTGLVTLNWRAAQERVLFEEVMESLGAGTPPRQALLFPIAMEFDPLTDAAISEHARFIRESGFELNPFGRLFYRLEAVPEWFEPAEAEQFMRDIAAQLRERGLRPEKQESAREQLARMAAAASTRNTPRPKEPELRALLNRLFRCKQPLSDPKGRPTLIETPKTELARKFGLGL